MGETEVRTAESSEHVTNASQTKSSSKASSKTGERAGSRPKLNERGVPVTQWDNPEQDPNLRVHAGDSPDGAENKDFKASKKAFKERS